MAAGILNPPGTEYGPCEEVCEHTDCAATRTMAERSCVHCGEVIGYDRGMFNVTPDGDPAWSKMAHAECEYRAIEGD